MPNQLPTTSILGVKVHTVTLPQALRAIEGLVESGQNHYIVTPNPEMVMYAQKQKWFREILAGASLSLADGVGLLWASKFNRLPLIPIPGFKQIQAIVNMIITGASIPFAPGWLSVIPERITGADMVWELSKLASERNWSVFLLGAGPGVALKAARTLQQLYPRLNVVEVMVGPPYESEEEVLRAIQFTKPQIIFLAFPADKQMRWMRDWLPQLENTVVMGIGGALDFIVEATALNSNSKNSPARRAPAFIRAIGLEWLWRLVTQPWRKDRVKTATVDFISAVVHDKLD